MYRSLALLLAVALALIFPAGYLHASTPVATTQVIAIADGLNLLYYDITVRPVPCRMNCHIPALITGEIENTGPAAFDSPTLLFTFLDNERNILGVVEATPIVGIIDPGQRLPFDGNVTTDGPDVLGYTSIDVTAVNWGNQWRADGLAQRKLEVIDVEELESAPLVFKIEAAVRNVGDVNVERPAVFAAIYSESGRYAGGYQTFDLLNVSLPPGKTAKFQISSEGGPFEAIEVAGAGFRYELYAQ